MLMMVMTTRSSINVNARSNRFAGRAGSAERALSPSGPTHPRPLPGGEQAVVRVLSVPLLGGVRGGFIVSMHCQKPQGLSMNLPGHRIAACLGKAALKTHALQTLPRGPLTRPRARSVWSASDLSALFVRRGTASGSWAQCTVARPRRLSLNRGFVLVV